MKSPNSFSLRLSGGASFIELHWQQPLLIKQFADELSQNGALPTNWDDNSVLNKEFFGSLYSNPIAWAAGISANSNVAYKDMMSMIAYSAIDTEDGAAYGTNAIKSFFDDVDNIADFLAAVPAGAYDFTKQGLMERRRHHDADGGPWRLARRGRFLAARARQRRCVEAGRTVGADQRCTITVKAPAAPAQ